MATRSAGVLMAIFNLLLVAVFAHSMRFGGAPERIAAALFAAAAVATIAVASVVQYEAVSLPLLAIDGLLLIALTALALTADRYWPMWMAPLEMVAMATHAAKAYHPSIVPDAYWFISNLLAFPMITVLAAATVRHRGRLSRGLPEPNWTTRRERALPRGSG